MSEQQQGPGWWQASDGRWYPPQPGAVAPPPPSKRGRGCLYAVLGALALLVVLVVVAVASSSGGDKKTTTAASTPSTSPVGSGSKDNPASADAAITACTFDEMLKYSRAAVTITNGSSKASNYSVHVEFLQGATRVGEGYAISNNVAPGQVVRAEALGPSQAGASCRVADVTRFSAVG